jgi:hypothetical protein
VAFLSCLPDQLLRDWHDLDQSSSPLYSDPSANATVIAMNLVLLLCITWVPFPTTLLAEHLGDADQRVAATVYSGTFLVIAVLFNVRLWYAQRSGRVANAPEHSRALARQYALGPPHRSTRFCFSSERSTQSRAWCSAGCWQSISRCHCVSGGAARNSRCDLRATFW